MVTLFRHTVLFFYVYASTYRPPVRLVPLDNKPAPAHDAPRSRSFLRAGRPREDVDEHRLERSLRGTRFEEGLQSGFMGSYGRLAVGIMRTTIEFKSHVPVAQRAALEALVFFNRCQERVSECIADAVEKFGAPEIVADRDRLRIGMKNMPDVQCLFAIDARTGRPVGVAVYARQDIEHVTVMHLSIDEEFASGGPRAGEQLLLKLLREVRRSTRRVKGVRRLELYYASGRAASQRWRPQAKAMM